MSDDDAMDRMGYILDRMPLRVPEISYEEVVREYNRIQEEFMDVARRAGHEIDLRRLVAKGIYFAAQDKDCGLAECWRRFHEVRALGYDNTAIDMEYLAVSSLARSCLRYGDPTGAFEFVDPVLDRLRSEPKKTEYARSLSRLRDKLQALESARQGG